MPRVMLKIKPKTPVKRERVVLADDGPPIRTLVSLARKLGKNHPEYYGGLVEQMADKLEWIGKSYGLWGR